MYPWLMPYICLLFVFHMFPIPRGFRMNTFYVLFFAMRFKFMLISSGIELPHIRQHIVPQISSSPEPLAGTWFTAVNV